MAHIIIAEDEEIVRRWFELMVKQLCPSATMISAVANGQEALQVYEASGADLMFVNYQMPVMNGPVLVGTLRSRGVTIPIVMTSGDPWVSKKAYEAGATLFVEALELNHQLPRIISRYLPL